MKRLLLMTSITITLFLAGVLYGGYTHHERTEESKISQKYLNYHLDTMPNMVLDPMTNVPF
jgi:hypothetical protein